jgi:hypothetical protein
MRETTGQQQPLLIWGMKAMRRQGSRWLVNLLWTPKRGISKSPLGALLVTVSRKSSWSQMASAGRWLSARYPRKLTWFRRVPRWLGPSDTYTRLPRLSSSGKCARWAWEAGILIKMMIKASNRKKNNRKGKTILREQTYPSWITSVIKRKTTSQEGRWYRRA